ncbi:MAG: rod shape-determining protein RodA [Chroococcidiopsidaceae cyanobacterium CP_BM_ER_R8_30]|nr:rod shape-determining protein RodA [Chroococcidiopsidaceae cyanobacterium CP_BM_ER_R8_30]
MLQMSLLSLRWKDLIAPWQEVDWLLFALSAGVMVFGGIMIHSAELSQGLNNGWQQWLFGCLGLALALLIARYRYENLIQWHWIIYGMTNISLVAVMVMGIHAKGAQRWISIAGFNFQPSEFAKLGIIVTLAALLEPQTASQLSTVLRALAVTALLWILVFLQPDLGTSLVFGAITLRMLYWGNANPGWLLLLISPVVAAVLFNTYLPAWFGWAGAMSLIAFGTLPWRRVGAIVALAVNLVVGELGQIFWKLLKPYQKDRLILFLDPDKDPLGSGYHLIQSRIAIGAGGLWGQGLGHGTQTQLNFIPEQHTDFIFSAVGEELGFVGCSAVLYVFWLICLRLIVIAQNAKDNFGSLLAVGVLSMLVFQVIINIGMTVGLAPVTGIPLPWISYGRSALLTNFIAIGIVESVANYRQRLKF